MTRPTLLLLVGPLLLAPIALAACGSSKHVSASTTTTAAASPSQVITTSESTEQAPASTTQAVPSTSPTTPTTSAAPTSTAGPACTTKNLKVDALRGSGASGHQFALISFTNNGSAACTLSGIPQVTLMHAGAVLGSPAQASGKKSPLLTLAPAHTATTTLTGFSTCNAMNSDAVRIAAPGQTATVDTPLVLRGCRLEVDPMTAAGSMSTE